MDKEINSEKLDAMYKWLLKLQTGLWVKVHELAALSIRMLIDEGLHGMNDISLSEDYSLVIKRKYF